MALRSVKVRPLWMRCKLLLFTYFLSRILLSFFQALLTTPIHKPKPLPTPTTPLDHPLSDPCIFAVISARTTPINPHPVQKAAHPNLSNPLQSPEPAPTRRPPQPAPTRPARQSQTTSPPGGLTCPKPKPPHPRINSPKSCTRHPASTQPKYPFTAPHEHPATPSTPAPAPPADEYSH